MDQALLLITLGVLFLGGLLADKVGHLTRLPRVTMLLLLGVLVGQAGLNILPQSATDLFEPVSVVALTMVAFLLGGELTRENITSNGRAIFSISLSVVIGTTLAIWAGLSAIGLDPRLALLLGVIATATDPAAISEVIRQSGMRNGFTSTLKGIVAIDDVWGLLMFSICLALVDQSGGWAAPMLGAGRDIGGAVLLGLCVGIPSAILTGRLTPGEPLQTEAIGVVLLTAGIAIWLDVSYLVAGMTAGAYIANFARHHERTFNEIEHIEWPFMLLFFLLAGASLELHALWALGWFSLTYAGLRIAARIVSCEIGARIGSVPVAHRHIYGPALLPQAGVAVGMALVAADTFPQWGATIMTLTITTTVFFEIIGPPATLLALRMVERVQDGGAK